MVYPFPHELQHHPCYTNWLVYPSRFLVSGINYWGGNSNCTVLLWNSLKMRALANSNWQISPFGYFPLITTGTVRSPRYIDFNWNREMVTSKLTPFNQFNQLNCTYYGSVFKHLSNLTQVSIQLQKPNYC